ncbi:SHE4 [Blepharisma stoltei]|uniref:Uncharacterized protein n=1 Tax=Blepharisma stoltei TaxID=1481888 RepID=A0AAU9KA46_9CILI|nr:unnamed protein product [Blepharisma stoltei]
MQPLSSIGELLNLCSSTTDELGQFNLILTSNLESFSDKELFQLSDLLISILIKLKERGLLENYVRSCFCHNQNIFSSLFILSEFALIDWSLPISIFPVQNLVEFLISSDMKLCKQSLKLLINLASHKEPRFQISAILANLNEEILKSLNPDIEPLLILLLAKLSTTSILNRTSSLIDFANISKYLLDGNQNRKIILESLCYLTFHFEFKIKCLSYIDLILETKKFSYLPTIMKNLVISKEDEWIFHDKRKEITHEETKLIHNTLKNFVLLNDDYDSGPKDEILRIRSLLNSKNSQAALLGLFITANKKNISNFSKIDLIYFLFVMSENREMRIPILQYGGINFLIKGSALKPVIAGHTIARLLIFTNPSSLNYEVLIDSIPLLLKSLENAWHQLTEFEVLLALTNLASFNENIREALLSHGGWEIAFNMINSENVMIQRSSCELISNLVMSEKVINDLLARKKNKNIEALVLLLDSGDIQIISAILGTLANISRFDGLHYIFKENLTQTLEKFLENITDIPVIARILSIISHVPSIYNTKLENHIRSITEPSLQKYTEFIINIHKTY